MNAKRHFEMVRARLTPELLALNDQPRTRNVAERLRTFERLHGRPRTQSQIHLLRRCERRLGLPLTPLFEPQLFEEDPNDHEA